MTNDNQHNWLQHFTGQHHPVTSEAFPLLRHNDRNTTARSYRCVATPRCTGIQVQWDTTLYKPALPRTRAMRSPHSLHSQESFPPSTFWLCYDTVINLLHSSPEPRVTYLRFQATPSLVPRPLPDFISQPCSLVPRPHPS